MQRKREKIIYHDFKIKLFFTVTNIFLRLNLNQSRQSEYALLLFEINLNCRLPKFLNLCTALISLKFKSLLFRRISLLKCSLFKFSLGGNTSSNKSATQNNKTSLLLGVKEYYHCYVSFKWSYFVIIRTKEWRIF